MIIFVILQDETALVGPPAVQQQPGLGPDAGFIFERQGVLDITARGKGNFAGELLPDLFDAKGTRLLQVKQINHDFDQARDEFIDFTARMHPDVPTHAVA